MEISPPTAMFWIHMDFRPVAEAIHIEPPPTPKYQRKQLDHRKLEVNVDRRCFDHPPTVQSLDHLAWLPTDRL